MFGIIMSVAAAIDTFGLLGAQQTLFSWNMWVGLALMIGGVVVFKLELAK